MAMWKKMVTVGMVMSVLLIAGCTSGPAATVAPLETQVLLASGDGDPREVAEQADAAQGDVVSTDGDGLAEVVFPDGSFMRLGPDSEVEVTELGAAEVQRTSIALDIGATWHNVVELVAEDAVYEVVTPVGVASVRGTVFAVICVEGPSCEFIVFDGEIDVDGTTLTPYQRIVLPEQPEPAIVPVDALPDWAADNIERDADREDAEPLPDPPLEAASIAGEWTLVSTAVERGIQTDEAVGSSSERTWTIEQGDCDVETCVSPFVSSSGLEQSLTRQGTQVTGTWAGPLLDCVELETGEMRVPQSYSTQVTYDVVIGAAEMRAGVWTAVEMSGTQQYVATLMEEYRGACNPDPGRDTARDASTVEFSR